MTNEDAIKALTQLRTYASPAMLDEIEYAIEVLDKLEKNGIKDPLNADFSKVEKK